MIDFKKALILFIFFQVVLIVSIPLALDLLRSLITTSINNWIYGSSFNFPVGILLGFSFLLLFIPLLVHLLFLLVAFQDIEERDESWLWMVLILFTSTIGGIIYFMVSRSRAKAKAVLRKERKSSS